MIPERTSSYTLWFSDNAGRRIQPITDFQSLDYTLVTNGVGILKLTLPADRFPRQLIKPAGWVDAWIEVWRGYGYGPERLEGETVFLIRKMDTFVGPGGELYLEVTALDAKSILDARIVAALSGSAYAKKTAAGDTLMKAVVREHLSSLAVDATRALASSFFAVDGDTSLGASITLEFAKESVLSVCQKAAQASAQALTPLYFDVVLANQATRTLQFRTYTTARGTTRTLVFSQDRRNLVNARLSEDYTGQRTYAYAYGPGEAALQIIGTASDATEIALRPVGRRETNSDSRNGTVLATANNDASVALRNQRANTVLTGDIVNAPDSPYGSAWRHGDQIPVEFLGRTFVSNIETVHVTVTAATENVQAGIRSQYER
jgi:hypothetical protein